MEELQQRYPGQFLGPLAHLLYVASDTYRAEDVLRLLSGCFRDDLNRPLVANARMEQEMKRIPALHGMQPLRLDHISALWHKQHNMPHE